jgi:hypothetical protein
MSSVHVVFTAKTKKVDETRQITLMAQYTLHMRQYKSMDMYISYHKQFILKFRPRPNIQFPTRNDVINITGLSGLGLYLRRLSLTSAVFCRLSLSFVVFAQNAQSGVIPIPLRTSDYT